MLPKVLWPREDSVSPRAVVVFITLLLNLNLFNPALMFAQAPPTNSPEQLEQLVARIALYPDPLLAQILAGATFPDQIPDAARWADEHHYLRGDQLAAAINE